MDNKLRRWLLPILPEENPLFVRTFQTLYESFIRNRTEWLFPPMDTSQTELLLFAGNFPRWEFESVLRDYRKQTIRSEVYQTDLTEAIPP